MAVAAGRLNYPASCVPRVASWGVVEVITRLVNRPENGPMSHSTGSLPIDFPVTPGFREQEGGGGALRDEKAERSGGGSSRKVAIVADKSGLGKRETGRYYRDSEPEKTQLMHISSD